MFKKFLLALALVASFNIAPLSALADHNTAHTIQQIQEKINLLLIQIQNLQSASGGGSSGGVPVPVPPIATSVPPTPPPSVPFCHTFNTNLRIGDSGSEISDLQEALRRDGVGIEKYWTSGEFDEVTASSVSDFQEKYRSEILTPNGLSRGTGFVGVSTRAKLNRLYGCKIGSGGGGGGGPGMPPKPIPNPQSPVISGVSGPQSLKANEQGTWTVKASSSTGGNLSYSVVWGDEIYYKDFSAPALIPPITNQQSATFTHSYSQAGNYTPTFTVTNNSGQTAQTSLSVNVGGVVNTSSISVLSPNGGETWARGTMQTIKWQDNRTINCQVGSVCAYPTYDIKLIQYIQPCTGNVCTTQYPSTYIIANFVFGSSYNWFTGDMWEKGISPADGSYTIQICQTGSTSCDSSDSYFKITSIQNNNSPKIIGIPDIPITVQVGKEVNFSWTATDADGDNLSWSVDWGDASGLKGDCIINSSRNLTNQNFSASHTWVKASVFTVTATVSDCRGGIDNYSFVINIIGSDTPPISIVTGDVNNDGAVTVGDALKIQLHADGTTLLTGQSLINGDVTGEGTVNGIDALIVAQYAGGLIQKFPKEDGTTLLLGDANLNGAVNIGDALVITNHIIGTTKLIGRALDNADVDGNGKITDVDSSLVAQCSGGTVTSFPRGACSVVPPTPLPPPLPVTDYRYLQIKSSSNSWVAWHEIQVYDSASNLLKPVSCSASGNYLSSCEDVYVGKGGYWNAGDYNGVITLDFGSNKNIAQVKLLPSNSPNPATATHELLVRIDGANDFANLKTFSGQFYDQQWITYPSTTSKTTSSNLANILNALLPIFDSLSKSLK